ncbi:hypothetical protein TNIN_92071 [Trichonephila inaurata madagascariensis]|uniref:Uncharacterized protein n=1 Tax=Trichonephila inaurata madagascariensis TaxID=2747483 RepID=A0A8X6IK52_9ARAC|nr:hypothetical protein TNIN_92071 [Trichonephila inaurata madagascariensis]
MVEELKTGIEGCRTLETLLRKDKSPSIKKIGKKNPFLPPSASQTSNSGQGTPPTAESSDSEIEDEEAGKRNPTAVGTPENRIPPNLINPSLPTIGAL